MQSSRDHDVTRMVNRPPAPVKVPQEKHGPKDK